MSETKTPAETRRALQAALEEHIAAVEAANVCEDPGCDDCDGEAGLLTTWVVLYETVITGKQGPNGETMYANNYCTSDSGPAQCVGVSEIGLGRLKQDLI